MDRTNSSEAAMNGRGDRARTINAPQRHEGLGNALRAAFDPGAYGLPDEMAQLLRQMDR